MSDIRLKEDDIRKLFDLEPEDEYESWDLQNVEKLRRLTYNPDFSSFYYQIDPLWFLERFRNAPMEDAIYYLLKQQAEARLDEARRGSDSVAWGDLQITPVQPQPVQTHAEADPNTNLTNKELLSKCKLLNLKGYSKKNKAELVEFLAGR